MIFSDYARVCSPMLLKVASAAVIQLQVVVTVGEHDSPEFLRQSKQFSEVRKFYIFVIFNKYVIKGGTCFL